MSGGMGRLYRGETTFNFFGRKRHFKIHLSSSVDDYRVVKLNLRRIRSISKAPAADAIGEIEYAYSRSDNRSFQTQRGLKRDMPV